MAPLLEGRSDNAYEAYIHSHSYHTIIENGVNWDTQSWYWKCLVLIQEWKIQEDFCATYDENDVTAFINSSM